MRPADGGGHVFSKRACKSGKALYKQFPIVCCELMRHAHRCACDHGFGDGS